MITITRGDGERTKVRTRVWQHDPYHAYIGVSPRVKARLEKWQAASVPVEGYLDRREHPTNTEPLRWGRYGAVLRIMIGDGRQCPHCRGLR